MEDNLGNGFARSPRETSVTTRKQKGLAVPKPQSEEKEVPLLPIPHLGYGGDWDEPTDTELDKFSQEHTDFWERIFFCPQINRDLLDDRGHYGYIPGFIYVKATEYKGARTFSDLFLLEGKTLQPRVTPSGINIWEIPHYDLFPRHKTDSVTITAENNNPSTYGYLHRRTETGRGVLSLADLSSLSSEELLSEVSLADNMLYLISTYESNLTRKREDLSFWDKMSKTGKPMDVEEAGNMATNTKRRLDYASRAESVKEMIDAIELQRPRYEQLYVARVERMLSLLEECRRRSIQVSEDKIGTFNRDHDQIVANAANFAKKNGQEDMERKLKTADKTIPLSLSNPLEEK